MEEAISLSQSAFNQELLLVRLTIENRRPTALSNNKKAAPRFEGTAESSQCPLNSGFPTLVLPRSGCEGRPIDRTLSRWGPPSYWGESYAV
jgi:hypothetical protein